MTKRINPKSTRGGIRLGLTARMPKRFSAPASIMEVGSATANPPVTFKPPRPSPALKLSLMGLKVGGR
jgi:hypothetical protein